VSLLKTTSLASLYSSSSVLNAFLGDATNPHKALPINSAKAEPPNKSFTSFALSDGVLLVNFNI
jgi:hypothetical protein